MFCGSLWLVCALARAQPRSLDAGLPASASARATDASFSLDAGSDLDGGLGPDGRSASEAVPPVALYVPELLLPDGGAGSLSATILVRRDGSSALHECTSAPESCALVTSALLDARFQPARVGGRDVDALVRVRFVVRGVDAGAALQLQTLDAGRDAATSLPEPPPIERAEYGAEARVQHTPPTAVALELAEMRAIPGTFGDPFRVLDALPGVVPVMSAIPYVYVRGAPPASTIYFYDDIQLPALFHLGLGPAVVHAAMIGPIDFYPGVAPARYGRKTGGVMAGQAAQRALEPGVHGEIELRPIDLQAYLSKPFDNGARLELGGRYGYPALLLMALEPAAVLQYWDYQLRGVLPVTPQSELSLIALGSYDLVGEREQGRVQRDLELQFHRLELRSVTRFSRATLGAAVGGGIERSGLGDDFDLQSLRVGPRVWLTFELGQAKLRAGADMLLSFGKLDDPRDDRGETTHGELRRDPVTGEYTMETVTVEGRPENPAYLSAKRRYVSGAYLELAWPFAARYQLEAGLRGDVWVTGGEAEPALEPRLLLRRELTERVSVHAAFGLAYQPAVFMIPLPGLTDVAIDRGLQRAIQQELGVKFELPASFSVEAKAYLHLYDRMLSIESLEDDVSECVMSESLEVGCDDEDELGRMSAHSYGGELMLRRAFKERLSGWLAYTLSWADGKSSNGLELRPHFDVRHVANLIVLWRISDKWRFSLRGFAQSGRFPLGASSEENPRARRRLPPFWRGDLQFARVWKKRWGELQLTFDWLNFTLQKEPIGWERCEDAGGCRVERIEAPITIPMFGLRATY